MMKRIVRRYAKETRNRIRRMIVWSASNFQRLLLTIRDLIRLRGRPAVLPPRRPRIIRFFSLPELRLRKADIKFRSHPNLSKGY
ncbi:hypothetical protein Trydic_g21077 [Trypoxylus dichotomus]